MNKMHQLEITPELLQTFIATFEDGSIASAAIRMEQNPSTLSHRIDRLKKILGEELFVRAGRGIVPTSFAEEIVSDARIALNAIQSIGEHQMFKPENLEYEFTIATTDMERSTFILDAYKNILIDAPNVKFRFVWQGYAESKALRQQEVDFIISPIDASSDADIRKRLLFRDRAVCFYDASNNRPPDTLEEYLNARHVRVMFSESDVNLTDFALQVVGRQRNISVTMPSVSELPMLMKGTKFVTTIPSRLSETIMRDFSFCLLPFKMNNMAFNLYWHERTQNSPKHKWLRQRFFDFADRRAEYKKLPPLK